MKEPDAGVIGAEAKHNVAVGTNEDRITTHGCGGRCSRVSSVVGAAILVAAGYNLEGVTVEMEGMSARGSR